MLITSPCMTSWPPIRLLAISSRCGNCSFGPTAKTSTPSGGRGLRSILWPDHASAATDWRRSGWASHGDRIDVTRELSLGFVHVHGSHAPYPQAIKAGGPTCRPSRVACNPASLFRGADTAATIMNSASSTSWRSTSAARTRASRRDSSHQRSTS